MATQVVTAPFRVGQKEIYLPRFRLALLRTPFLPPQYAAFRVPLWFSKLDLRDYLYHAYSVRIVSVRSYIKQQRLTQGRDHEDIRQPQPNRWYRPKAQKRMTVELERPFVWPDPPEDLSPWNKESVDMQQKAGKARQRQTTDTMKDTVGVSDDERKSLRDQARALLEGKEKWQPRISVDESIPHAIGMGKLVRKLY